jgi:hypothetical protein
MRIALFLLLLGLCLPLQAEELYAALYFQRDEMTLRSGGADVDTRIGRFGVSITSVYSPYLDGSLDIGHASLTQGGNPATQGMSLPGEYMGIAVRAWPLRSCYLDAWVQGDYTFLSVSGTSGGQSAEIELDEAGVSAGVVVHAGPVDMVAGVQQASVSGDEIASGAVTYTRSVRLEDKTTVWAGVDLLVDDRGGTIGVLFSSGGRSGIALRFARRF